MVLPKSDLKRCAGKKLHNVPLDNVSLSIGKIFLQFNVYQIFATVCGFLLHKGFFEPIVCKCRKGNLPQLPVGEYISQILTHYAYNQIGSEK